CLHRALPRELRLRAARQHQECACALARRHPVGKAAKESLRQTSLGLLFGARRWERMRPSQALGLAFELGCHGRDLAGSTSIDASRTQTPDVVASSARLGQGDEARFYVRVTEHRFLAALTAAFTEGRPAQDVTLAEERGRLAAGLEDAELGAREDDATEPGGGAQARQLPSDGREAAGPIQGAQELEFRARGREERRGRRR